MRDILDDDERKVKPLGLLMLTTSTILGAMIIYNTMFAQPKTGGTGTTVAMMTNATTHVDVAPLAEVSNTVVFKYDSAVEDVQRELLATGHFKGLVDGVNGQKTKIAIQLYQQEAGLPVTGEITPELINHIHYTRKVQAASQYTGSTDPAPAVVPPAVSPSVAAPVAAIDNAEVSAPVVPVSKNQSQNTKVISVQKALVAMGYAIDVADGQLNAQTRAAILQYEMDNGLAMDGVIDQQFLKALGPKFASGN